MPKAALPAKLKAQLQKQGYSERMMEELWKWYGYSEKKGVTSF